jgi:hypothetical protein
MNSRFEQNTKGKQSALSLPAFMTDLKPLLTYLQSMHRTLEGADERIRSLCSQVEIALSENLSMDDKVVVFDYLDSYIVNIDGLVSETKAEIEKTKALLEPEVVTYIEQRKEDVRLAAFARAEDDIEEELLLDRRMPDSNETGRFVQKEALRYRSGKKQFAKMKQ